MLRKLLLTLPLSLLMLLSFSTGGFAQRSDKAIRDFSYLRKDLRSLEQKMEDFIKDVKSGNRQAFKYVTYDVVEGVIVKLKREADQYRTTRTLKENRVMQYLLDTTADDKEKAFQTLVRATLPGIFNMDPRVRLVATDWLRGLRPDASMARAVKLAVGVDINVIRYDHKKGQFVFTHPRILETVASGYEYYREKDLDWPTSFQSGNYPTLGGGGPNNDPKKIYSESNSLRDAGPENATTALNARRWGDFAPVYNEDKGYVPVSLEEREKIIKKWADMLAKAEEEAQARWGGDIYARDLDLYRKYPKVMDEDGKRKDAQLLFEQFYQMGEHVPLGQGRKYIYLNREGQLLMATPWAELTKLDEFITRWVWWQKIRNGQKQVMTFLSKDTFGTLFRSIDGETPERIPFLSFATSRPMVNATEREKVIDVLITGLHKNKVLSNKYVIIRALKDIYRDRFGKLETTDKDREQINIALWEFKREANRLDYQAGRDVVAESITLGKRPADDWKPIEPVGKGKRAEIELVDLGFRLPNDEVLSQSYRLITTEPTSDSNPAQEAKVNIEELYNSRFYAYRRADGSFVTWYNNQTEWKTRAGDQNVSKGVDQVSSNWIYNYDQMDKAQKLINTILAGDPEVLRTAIWSDVESAVILTLYRVQLKYGETAAVTPSTVVTTFFDQLRRQDVIVDNADAKLPENKNKIRTKMFVSEKAMAAGDKFKNDTFSEEKREAIKQAALGGLFNKDPRIRLTSIHFLRRLGPDESMLESVISARSIMAGSDDEKSLPDTTDYLNRFVDTNIYTRAKLTDFQAVNWNRYKGVVPDSELLDKDKDQIEFVLNPKYTPAAFEYQHGLDSQIEKKLVSFFGIYQLKSPGEELEKLYGFIQRRKLVRAIKRGDVNAITKLSRADFTILSDIVDDEYALRVPLMSFHSDTANRESRTAVPSRYAVFNADDVRVIKRGIDNSNFLVQKGTADYLKRFYDFYNGFKKDEPVKKEIRDAMYFYKQDDIAVEEFVLAFEGENPDGRSVILAGTDLSSDINPGGERVFRTLPVGILKDIRDAVLGEIEKLPDELKGILGILSTRASRAGSTLEYDPKAEAPTASVREKPVVPPGDTSTVPSSGLGTTPAAPAPMVP